MALPWQTLIALLERTYLDMQVADTTVPTHPVVTSGPQSSPSKINPKFRIFANADLTTSGFLSTTFAARSNVNAIAHAYRTHGSTPASMAEEIADHFELFDLKRGAGDALGGLYSGSFFIQNEATGTHDLVEPDRAPGLFYNEDDLITGWGNSGDSLADPDNFAPFFLNAVVANRAFSLSCAQELKTRLDDRGLCLPALKLDDWEFRGGSFPSFDHALLFDTSNSSANAGYISSGALQADERFGDNANWLLAERTAIGTVDNFVTWQQMLDLAPARNDLQKWSHSSNRAFSNWLASRFIEASSAALYFGAEFGFRQFFPGLRTSNYNLFLGSEVDNGTPNFGGTNDFTWVRKSPRANFFWQDFSAPVLYGADLNGRILPGESHSDFYRRVSIERLLACRAASTGNLITPWMNGPGISIKIDHTLNVNYTVTADDVYVIAKACLLAGVIEFIMFCPGAPYAHWAVLDEVRTELTRWARRFFQGGRKGSRILTLSRNTS